MISPHTNVGPLYMGVELSTQQLKVLVVNDDLSTFFEDSLNYDSEFPSYGTIGGVKIEEDGLTVTTPTLLWVKALDTMLERMKAASFPFARVVSISGNGQQHGSVYWRTSTMSLLENLDPSLLLSDQLKDCFSIENSPVWMDSSTYKQCRHLEQAVGGAQNLANITGSRAYERFTGNQISKVFHCFPEKYEDTERISLVSSFCASLFLGSYAPIDVSDGSGMNLMDIKTHSWSQVCLDACAPQLTKRLGPVINSTDSIGCVSSYMCDRYGFSPDCQLISFTGDNPASLAGMRAQPGDVIVSLGTSDTLFLWLNEPCPALEGHVFVNPVSSQEFMALLCFKNGSLTRQRLRDELADGSWEKFANLLVEAPIGNEGNIGIFFDVKEITPELSGCHRINKSDDHISSFDKPSTEIRALIEGQFMAKRIHAQQLGYKIGRSTRILATGGASINKHILQVLADVFGAPVYTQDVANSACLGSAYMAKFGKCGCDKNKFSEIITSGSEISLVATPTAGSEKIYEKLCDRYKQFEERLIALT